MANLGSKTYHTSPMVLVIAVAILAIIGLVVAVRYTSAPESVDTGGAYVPITTTVPTTASNGQTVAQPTTEVVGAGELDVKVQSPEDLQNAQTTLETVDVDYLDTLSQQNETEATQF